MQRLDELVLNATAQELAKIQEVDCQTQMDGLSLYEVYLDSGLTNQNIRPSGKS